MNKRAGYVFNAFINITCFFKFSNIAQNFLCIFVIKNIETKEENVKLSRNTM